MKKRIKKVLYFIAKSCSFLKFTAKVVLQGSYKNKIKKQFVGTVAVLANGPSLKEVIPKLTTSDEFTSLDFIVLNFFAFEETFYQIKPQHYCLADPMFFADSLKTKDIRKMYNLLESKVDWNMFLYIPALNYKNFLTYSRITNSKIKVVKLSTNDYYGYEKFRNYFYKIGFAMPSPKTVANMAIYVGLNSGYKELRLYGVDHTFFDSLIVNELNQLCHKQEHFYSSTPKLEPIIRNHDGFQYNMSEYLKDLAFLFRSHDLLEKYSEFLKVDILNFTKNSLIDSYDRKID